MRVLTFLTFVLAIAFMAAMDIFLFSEDVLYGIGGVIDIIAFFIAYSISDNIIKKKKNYWRLNN